MLEAGVGILLQVPLEPLQGRRDWSLEGSREDALLVARLAGPSQGVTATSNVPIILMERDPERLHTVLVVQI